MKRSAQIPLPVWMMLMLRDQYVRVFYVGGSCCFCAEYLLSVWPSFLVSAYAHSFSKKALFYVTCGAFFREKKVLKVRAFTLNILEMRSNSTYIRCSKCSVSVVLLLRFIQLCVSQKNLAFKELRFKKCSTLCYIHLCIPYFILCYVEALCS